MIKDIVSAVASVAGEFVEDKDKRNELNAKIEQSLIGLQKGQMDINREEARSGNWFASSWRPLIGYICGIALFWHFIGLQIAYFIIACGGWNVPPLPTFEMDALFTILTGMLGLSSLRSFEKYKGLTK